MTEIQLNMFDTGVIIVMLFSCLFAFFRGFVKEILSLVAWIGAGVFMLSYFDSAYAVIAPNFSTPMLGVFVTSASLYLIALLTISLVNSVFLKFISRSQDIAAVDSFLGLIFGAIRGGFILSLVYLMSTVLLPENEFPAWMKDAKTRPYVEKGAKMLASVAPDYAQRIDGLQKSLEEEVIKQYQPPQNLADPDLLEPRSSPYQRRFLFDDNSPYSTNQPQQQPAPKADDDYPYYYPPEKQ